MTSDSQATCGECGRVLDVDPATNADAVREPCPYCGSTSRGIIVHAETAAFAATGVGARGHIELSGDAGLAVEASTTASGTVGSGAPDVQHDSPGVLPGQRIAHRRQFVVSEPNESGCFTAAVLDAQGNEIAAAHGDGVVDALLSLATALLPPDHPDYDDGPRE
jgi:hypothetical protein